MTSSARASRLWEEPPRNNNDLATYVLWMLAPIPCPSLAIPLALKCPHRLHWFRGPCVSPPAFPKCLMPLAKVGRSKRRPSCAFFQDGDNLAPRNRQKQKKPQL